MGDTAASLPSRLTTRNSFGVILPISPTHSLTYGSSGVNSIGSCVNWGSKFVGSVSESILGLYGGVTCLSSS